MARPSRRPLPGPPARAPGITGNAEGPELPGWLLARTRQASPVISPDGGDVARRDVALAAVPAPPCSCNRGPSEGVSGGLQDLTCKGFVSPSKVGNTRVRVATSVGDAKG